MNASLFLRITLIISVFLVSTFFNSSNAQVRYGVKAGANISGLLDVNGISKQRTGFNAGGLLLYPIDNNDQFYIQPEVIFSNEGEFLGDKDGKKYYKNFLEMIKVPILVKAYLSESENEFFGELGPYFGFKIAENIEQLDNPNGGQSFNSFDFGLAIGFGYSFSREIEVSARYSHGLSDMVDRDWLNSNNRSGVISFGLSYIFY